MRPTLSTSPSATTAADSMRLIAPHRAEDTSASLSWKSVHASSAVPSVCRPPSALAPRSRSEYPSTLCSSRSIKNITLYGGLEYEADQRSPHRGPLPRAHGPPLRSLRASPDPHRRRGRRRRTRYDDVPHVAARRRCTRPAPAAPERL